MNSSIKKSTGSVSSSLAFRAVLALLLMVGFYVLALAVAGLLIFLIFIQIASRIFNAYLSVFCLFGAWIIMWSIFPRIDRFIPPGPRLEAKNHPRLFAELESIAGAVGQPMPAEVYLIPEVNAWVGQRGGFMGIGSRRIMGLGLPLLETLNVSQLEAVLVHEFGHYYRGDTRLGPWVYKNA
jgi:Zn-dependent protease with chaperone function